jgi:hypothetical protein
MSAEPLAARAIRPVLGVDFGRVINDGASHPSGNDTAFLTGSEQMMLATPVMAGAIDGLTALVRDFESRVWIISKAGPRIQANTERWLSHHGFWDVTGIPSTQNRFVRQRRDKADVCAEVGVTHFVDDRSEVISTLDGVVAHRFLFGPQSAPCPRGATHVMTWADVVPAIRATL